MPKPKKGHTLTTKEKVFCLEYVQHWNGTRAAIQAGYSKKTARSVAHENLTKPYIKAEIQRVLSQKAMMAEEVLARLAAEASANMAELVEFYDVPILDKDGKHIGDKQSVRMKPEAFEKYGYLIKSINPTVSGDLKFELYDAQKAKELIGKHLGLFRDVSLNVDLSNLTDEQLERIAAGEDPVKVVANA